MKEDHKNIKEPVMRNILSWHNQNFPPPRHLPAIDNDKYLSGLAPSVFQEEDW